MQNDVGAPGSPAPEDEAGSNPRRQAPPLPEALRNWQVLEIDGEATPVGEVGPRPLPGASPAGERPAPQIQDRPDEIVVAALEARFVAVEAGTPARFVLGLINNGPHAATFHAQLEGWIDERWPSAGAVQVALQPGERARLLLELTPPRQPTVVAGDYQVAAVVRAVEYPGHTARIGAVLAVKPYDALTLHVAGPPDLAVNWLRRRAALAATLANQGNRAVTVHLEGTSPAPGCRFAFAAPRSPEGPPAVTLAPGQTTTVPLEVVVTRFQPIGWHSRPVPLQIVARIAGEPAPAPRRARLALAARPIVGPWHMAAGVSLFLAAVVGAGVLTVMALLLTRLEQVAAVPPATAPAAAMAAPPPVIIVNLNQPAAAPATPGSASDGALGADPDPALPLILPDQVTTPGSGAPAQPAVAVAASTGDSAGGALTYGQMFQTVAQQYDLDWRMLAAQAYVESGFDAVALSDAGAMGLMQVLPGTWREWAPAVAATDPFDAYSSVQVAAVYLDFLRTRLAEQGYTGTEWMLVAYNWGPDRLNDFLAAGGTWETMPEARRQYVMEIMRIAETLP